MDLNLLIALNALLDEGSVLGAAKADEFGRSGDEPDARGEFGAPWTTRFWCAPAGAWCRRHTGGRHRQAWHPHFDQDSGHRWLRGAVRKALTARGHLARS